MSPRKAHRTRDNPARHAGHTLAPSPSRRAAPDSFHRNVAIAGDVISCGTTEYTITSGTIKFAIHEGESASGNQNFTGTVTPSKVVATDGGTTYAVRGAFWFGGTYNAQQDTEQFTFTGKPQIVVPGGGTADSVNITFHVSPNGTVKEFDFGSCAEPS
jgi:hypothetical protein